MFEPLIPVREKIRRADRYIDEIDDIVSAFLKGKPYSFVIERHPKEREIWVIIEVRDELPAARLGVIVSDTVHNLRSALDQLVWTLTFWHQGTVPREPLPKRNCWWRSVQFPVCLKASDWRSEENNRLKGIRPDLRGVIKNVQPFASGQPPDRHPLWVLQELWNRDKHRAVPLLFGGTVGLIPPTPPVLLLHAIFGRPFFTSLPTKGVGKAYGPIKDGNVILAFETSERSPIADSEIWDYLGHYARPSFDVLLDKGPPAYQAPVRRTLRAMRCSVVEIVELLAPVFVRERRVTRSRKPCPPPK